MPKAKSQKKKTLNLALQGGGSHGAFTWGVLDALLEDGRLEFEGISATSAGAMNAAVLAYGKTIGGNEKARELLDEFWWRISQNGAFYRPAYQTSLGRFFGLDHNPMITLTQSILSTISPYHFNPLNYNPLEEILSDMIDFDKLCADQCTRLFITATNVRSGTAKVFKNEEVNLDVLLASACLPHLFQAVEIDGEAYWDGGYMGNPSLWPLFYHVETNDILLVHINPIAREQVPKTMEEIENRLNEITFNTSLLKELRAIDFVKKLIAEDMLKGEHKKRYTNILLHAIRTDDFMSDLDAQSKYNTEWSFLNDLKEMGRREAQNWLQKHYKDLGKKSSVNIQDDYLSKL